MAWATSHRAAQLPTGWARTCARVLHRDGYVCQLHLARVCTGLATEVDHIGDRNDHDDANLQAVCSDCHKIKTQAESMAGRVTMTRPGEAHPGIRS